MYSIDFKKVKEQKIRDGHKTYFTMEVIKQNLTYINHATRNAEREEKLKQLKSFIKNGDIQNIKRFVHDELHTFNHLIAHLETFNEIILTLFSAILNCSPHDIEIIDDNPPSHEPKIFIYLRYRPFNMMQKSASYQEVTTMCKKTGEYNSPFGLINIKGMDICEDVPTYYIVPDLSGTTFSAVNFCIYPNNTSILDDIIKSSILDIKIKREVLDELLKLNYPCSHVNHPIPHGYIERALNIGSMQYINFVFMTITTGPNETDLLSVAIRTRIPEVINFMLERGIFPNRTNINDAINICDIDLFKRLVTESGLNVTAHELNTSLEASPTCGKIILYIYRILGVRPDVECLLTTIKTHQYHLMIAFVQENKTIIDIQAFILAVIEYYDDFDDILADAILHDTAKLILDARRTPCTQETADLAVLTHRPDIIFLIDIYCKKQIANFGPIVDVRKNYPKQTDRFLPTPNVTTQWMNYCALKDANLAKEQLVTLCRKYGNVCSNGNPGGIESMTKYQICAQLSINLDKVTREKIIFELCKDKASSKEIAKKLKLSATEKPETYVNENICKSLKKHDCHNDTDLSGESVEYEQFVIKENGYCFSSEDIIELKKNGEIRIQNNPYTNAPFSEQFAVQADAHIAQSDIHKLIHNPRQLEKRFNNIVKLISERFPDNINYFPWNLFKSLDVATLNLVIDEANEVIGEDALEKELGYGNFNVICEFLEKLYKNRPVNGGLILTAIGTVLSSINEVSDPYPEIRKYFDEILPQHLKEKAIHKGIAKEHTKLKQASDKQERLKYIRFLKSLKGKYTGTTAYLYQIFMAKELSLEDKAHSLKAGSELKYNLMPNLDNTLNTLKMLSHLYYNAHHEHLHILHPIARMIELFKNTKKGLYNELSNATIAELVLYNPKIGSIHISDIGGSYMPFYPTMLSFIAIIDRFKNDYAKTLEYFDKSNEACLNAVFETYASEKDNISANDKLNRIILWFVAEKYPALDFSNPANIEIVIRALLNYVPMAPSFAQIKLQLMKEKRMTSEQYDKHLLTHIKNALQYL